MDESTAKALKLLRLNHVTARDIARYTGSGKEKARRIIDTLSVEHPVYEIKRGLYGLLPGKEGRRGPVGIIARRRAAAAR
jgi:hypothetical protein